MKEKLIILGAAIAAIAAMAIGGIAESNAAEEKTLAQEEEREHREGLQEEWKRLNKKRR